MKKIPYILKDLSIYKMPGFPRGLESLNDLAANINIIAGANASGKSSTASVIQQLIWHDNTKGLEVEGSVVLDKEIWEIKIDSEKTLVQKNGNEDEISGLPTVEGRHRYLLALHKLVEDEENDLAKEIAKQSIGGYDLDAAQKLLGYFSRPYNKGVSEYKTVKEAEKKYKEVRDQQKELKKEEGNLSNLKEEKEKAQYAAKLSEFYDKVADFLEAKLEYTRLSYQMKEFPDSMEKLSGEEFERVQDFESQIEECHQAIEQFQDEIEKNQKKLEKFTIPEEGISDKTISEIEKRLERLSDLERDIGDSDKQIAKLKSIESEVLKGLDDSIDPTEWKDLNINDVSGLDKMLKDANQVLGEKEVLDSEIKFMEEEAQYYTNEDQNSETIVHAINALGEWLKEPTGAKGIPLWLVISISLLGVATSIVTFFVGWPGLLGLALIAALFLYTYFTNNKNSNTLNLRKNDFLKSGLTPPSQWNTENVAERIEELIKNLRDIKEAEGIRHRLKNCKDNLEKLQKRLDKINEKREEWVEKIQTAPGFPETNSNDFSSLYWFLIQVNKWQDAHIQKESLEAQKREMEEVYKNEMNKVNALFEKSNFDVVNDVAEGKATFNELKEQETKRKDQTRLIEQKKEQIKEQKKLKHRATEKLSKIYQSLGIEENDKESVRDLVKQLDDYQQKSKDHYAAEQAFSKKESLLKEHSLYNEYEGEIKDLSVDQAQELASKKKQMAEELETIQEKITTIETRIRDKKKGHELEDVLSEKEEALDRLEQLYENNLSSATGDLILNQFKKETQNQNRPKVFKRANEILNNITNGRYELLLGEKVEPNFKAYDTVLKLGQNLSELSTGTRVQLLLSVRLAYVETVESSIKLPLLADELLANSDDERAKAIIESLIEISREGRQIFYFTAQADEVSKWLAYLKEQKDLEHKIVELCGGSNESYNYREFKPDLSSFTLTQQIPPPNGKDHKEYGEIIRRQPFNVLTQNCSELSLWYLIEDLDLLYACLKRGIKNWGQLESYNRINGQIQNFDEEIFDQINNKVELLKRFQELYRKGRSRPIDRDVLENSGAITGAFIDKIVEKLNELNGEPKQLLQALRDGDIPRFRTDNADLLEQYLMTEGYIYDQEALETDEIIINLHAFISNSEMEIEEVENFINRILRSGDVTEQDIS